MSAETKTTRRRFYSPSLSVLEVREGDSITRSIDFGNISGNTRGKMIMHAIAWAIAHGNSNEEILSGSAFADREPAPPEDTIGPVLAAIIAVRTKELWDADEDQVIYSSWDACNALVHEWAFKLSKEQRAALRRLPSVKAAILAAKDAPTMDEMLAGVRQEQDELVDA